MNEAKLSLCLSCTLALAACADASDEGEGSSAASTASETSASETGDTGESDTGEPVPDSLAHDIDISTVEVTQGVAIPIVVDGEWVGAADRNAPIAGARPTLIRVYWERAPEFEAREIEARLTLDDGVGEPEVRSQRLLIDKEAYPGDLNRSFYFDLVEDQVVPGLQFSVSLWETEAEFAVLEPPIVAPVSPRDGALAPIGIQPEPLELEVMIVPTIVDWPGCSTTVPVDELLPLFEDMIYMKTALQSVTLTVRTEPLVLTEEPTSLWQLFEALQQFRLDDGAADNQYYYAVLDACAGDIDGAGGMAFSIAGPAKDTAYERVATGLWFGDDQWAADTFVHEIGHTQGLAHVACPGQSAALPDPAYPYPDGQIGVWGFGLRDFGLRSPTAAHDFMSYCYDGNWSSDWTWSKTFERVRTLTAWSYEAPAPDSTSAAGEVLIQIIPDDGRAPISWTTRGRLGPTQHELQVSARSDSGEARQLRARRSRLADGAAQLLIAELPPREAGETWTLESPRLSP